MLKTRRVVIISGARQSGKTTLARQILSTEGLYRTLDDENLLALAVSDPMGFLKHKQGTLIVDEIQKAPVLLSAIKRIVDSNNEPGQFLLTGSADVRNLPEVTESLAGRVTNVHLRPFTVGELLEKSPAFSKKRLPENGLCK